MFAVNNDNGREILLGVVRGIQSNKDYLGEVDGLIGDGDHGMNMNKGFTLYAEKLGDGETKFSEGLYDIGYILLNKIGGSMGPIYGTIFMEMSDAAGDAGQISLPLFRDMLQAGIDGLYDIVDARPGDKTLVDTLFPALESLSHAIDQETSFPEALQNMQSAADSGKESTKNMVAKYGRAARLGDRSRGVLDAGATSCYIILQSIADGMKQAMEEFL